MVVENSNGGGTDGAGATGAGVADGAGSTGAAVGESGGGAGAGAQTGGDGDGGDPPAYVPNYKYKVTAAQQGGAAAKLEKELPEWARPYVTSPDLEKNFRETFEKADGIDAVKQHRDLLVQENDQMRTQWAPIVQNVQTVVGHLERGDYDSFFEAVNIPEATILKYALYRLQLRENPQALQSHNQMRDLQNQNLQLQQQLQQTTGGYENLSVQTRTQQLDTHLGGQEILPAAQSFDARVGKPGAFRNEVITRGQMYAAQGRDVPVDQVTREVLQLIGWQGQNPPPANVLNGAGGAAATGGQAGGTAGGLGGEPKPTFPSIRGKGTSPAKKIIKSTDQLRALSRQMS